MKYTAEFRSNPPLPAVGAVYYEMDTREDDGSAPASRTASTIDGGAAARGDEAAHGGGLRAGARPRGAAAGPGPH